MGQCDDCRYLTYEDADDSEGFQIIYRCLCTDGCAKENGTYDDYYEEE